MASRLARWGNIYSRVDGLLRKGGISRESEKPLWFDVYKHFPPVDEPDFDRPVKRDKIREIFYLEDKQRALVHKAFQKNLGLFEISDSNRETKSQKCLREFNEHLSSGLTEEEALKNIESSFEKITESSKDKNQPLEITKIFESNDKKSD